MDARPDASAQPMTSPNLHWTGWRLRIVWAIWAMVAFMIVIVASETIPEFVNDALHGGPVTVHTIQNGISPAIYFPLDFSLSAIQLVVWWSIAFFVIFKKPNDWMILAFSMITLINGYFIGCFDQVFPVVPSVTWLLHHKYLNNLAQILDIVTYGANFVFCGVFPDGRFVLRWLRPVFIGLFAYVAVEDLLIIVNPLIVGYSNFSNIVRFAVILPLLVFALLYHLRHENPVQRQQTKMAVVGFILAIVGNIIDNLFLNEFGQTAYIIFRPTSFLLYIGSAICFLYALLRYHLWDIDFAINRSLVYGLLTVLLGAIFAGGFFTLRVALVSLFGRQQDLIAVAIPAVVITALFTPTLNRIRRFVDKNLYGIALDYRKVAEEQASKQKRQQLPGGMIDSFGLYKNLELVGRGGMSEVYRSHHPTLDRDVAIKILSRNLGRDEAARKRFEHEAQAISMLSHPNIETLYEYGEQDGVPYMVLEFLEGQTLAQMLKNKGRLALPEALPILQDIASALDYVHARGIVHRDIKPSNVIVEQKANAAEKRLQRVVLTDFGIAKLHNVTHLTSTGSLLGTLDYVSPEQIHGASEVDARSDIYSFGIMAYELLTGVLPFGHKHPGALIMAHLMQLAPDPRLIVPDLPGAAAEALMQAMAKDPKARQNTLGELVKAVEGSVDGQHEVTLTQSPEPLTGMA